MFDSAALDFDGMLATGIESYANLSPWNGTALSSTVKGAACMQLRAQIIFQHFLKNTSHLLS